MEDQELIEFEEEETAETPAEESKTEEGQPEKKTEEKPEEMAKKKKKKYPYPYEESLEARIENLEGLMREILELLKKKKKKKYPYPYEEEKAKLESPMTEAIKKLKEQFENLSKKVETLEKTPVRLTETVGAGENPADAIKRFRENLTAADAIIFAETHGIEYGDVVK